MLFPDAFVFLPVLEYLTLAPVGLEKTSGQLPSLGLKETATSWDSLDESRA